MNWARAFFGMIIVAAGSLLLLDNLDLLDAGEIIGDWWPAALVVGGALGFLANPRHWVIPLILVAGGALVLLRTIGVIDTLDVLLPAALIIFGLLVLFGRGLGTRSATTEDQVNTFNLFSGSEIASKSTSSRGGRIGAIFGGAEIDLRHATLAPDAELDVFAAFGGVEISVPEGWRVDINGFPLFGGFENVTAKQPLSEEAPRLRIDATVLFGGIEVRHRSLPSRCVGKTRTIDAVIEPDHHEEELFEEWELSEDDFEPLPPPPWRKPLLIAVATLTAIAMAVVPLYNVFVGRSVADNGLEICGFDYCIVQEAMRETGVDLIMSELANTFLDDEAARALANDAADYLDIGPIDLQVVDDLEGRLGGVYDPATRSILIERPARAWTVLHEVAHAVETGHAEAYQSTLADLARWADGRTGS